jgi:lambda repressor-like predicted transcriptional regulator
MDNQVSIPRDVARVKRIVAQHGLTGAALARRFGVTPGHIYNCLRGHERPRHLQTAIARMVGMEPRELWGELYRDEPRWYESHFPETAATQGEPES